MRLYQIQAELYRARTEQHGFARRELTLEKKQELALKRDHRGSLIDEERGIIKKQQRDAYAEARKMLKRGW